ncbi:MAG: bifunctional DNA-formamidopyrimidine glycosylase/DNA-(apurinic or apyrimidinic site) lyase [Bryobacter sp.]|nr:bifunctional DNA-formamidopyrimidine glycosylase/DNA-(apurinic or apyrimidinic site) lyase [Bryobacter sp.]
MPELPEAEYMVRRLREFADGARIQRARVLRDSVAGIALARRARGTVLRYWRRAKNVLLDLDSGWTVRVQLGMTGHFYWIADANALPRFTRVVFELTGGGALVFEDARTFGGVEAHPTAEVPLVLAHYGPEPLDPGFSWTALRERAGRRREPVKQFLLDQSRVAGLGNIWAAESLFRARVHPERAVDSLRDAEWRALHASIRRTLERAIENTFKVTERPEEFPEADLLRLNVYGRAGASCRRCHTTIVRTVQGGRATFFCPRCQK